jgi:hypothetical protein
LQSAMGAGGGQVPLLIVADKAYQKHKVKEN